MNRNYLDMLGFVSHELKGIIGSVIMSVYSVRDGFLGFMNFKQRKALDSAVRNLERLEVTVKNYLDLSRIEKGELSVKRREVNLNEEIINEAVDTFSKQFSEKKIILDNRVPETLKVFADKDLLLTVYHNLLSNAMKYGTIGGRISLQSEDRGEYIRLSVYNDGIPISEDKIGGLFKKFSRLTTEQQRKITGAGLGLFIVREIVEKHGGKIWFEPKEKGNEFIFEIKKGK
ncbi:HAMP domain-containing histidine kinase [candidate division NPL-UPA2 bacterium]|nr:HAMP domain-containing histidine kinase [candidate division NPL-UPA2 bacterium]